MVADRVARNQPRDGGKASLARIAEEPAHGLDVAHLPVLVHGCEPRQRVPDPRRRRALSNRAADHLVLGAVRLRSGEDVVAPGDMAHVQQVREVGPGVVGLAARRVLPLVRRRERVLDRVHAAHRVRPAMAARRPLGDHEQVRRQARRRVRLEHVVLQHEVARVGPVVRQLACVVVAHHVGRVSPRADRHLWVRRAAVPQAAPGLADEAVHLAAVDVPDRVEQLVRAAVVLVPAVVVGPRAHVPDRVRYADGEMSVPPRDAVRARVRAEELVERAVLLHHDHDVADLVDPGRARRDRPFRRHAAAAAGCQHHRDEPRDPHPARQTQRPYPRGGEAAALG